MRDKAKEKINEKQRKKEQLQKKKQKQEETRQILQNLSKQVVPSNLLDRLSSVKELSQHAKKPRKESLNKTQDDEEEPHEKQMPEKHLKTEGPATQVNIFNTASFVSDKKMEVEKVQSKAEVPINKKDKRGNQVALEIEVKRMIPDISFEEFGTKRHENLHVEKNVQEVIEKITEAEQKADEEDEGFIDDELLKPFLLEMKNNYRNDVTRSPSQEEARRQLPIYVKEAEIVDVINNNLVTIICGATGSGKSTQTPQFLYENGYTNPTGPNPGKIAITQPRRLAAISLAKRVSEEMSVELGKEIAYQVRHETSSFNEKTRIKFMTDGILLNEMTSDFLLSEYSVIVIDEAHERKINTDLLLGLLSRVVNIRTKLALKERNESDKKSDNSYKYFPLRLVIMSATLRVEDFTENKFLFPKRINVVNVESRQYPVKIYFNKTTHENYLEEAIKKCVKIHRRLPPGDVLVFLTGEREIKEFCYRMQAELDREAFEIEDDEGMAEPQAAEKEAPTSISGERKKKGKLDLFSPDSDEEELALEETKAEEESKSPKAPGEESTIACEEQEKPAGHSENANVLSHFSEPPKKVIIYPLYSKLPLVDQERVFKKKDPEARMIVAATNVAETSLTIPNIKYVIDCGKEKKKVYSSKLSISKFIINWISRSSADQRSGRAGRTGPGYCYRLYSGAVYSNLFPKFSDPEIVKVPLESIVLQLKAIGIMNVLKFPFPTRPNLSNLRSAINSLIKIKALKTPNSKLLAEDEEEDGALAMLPADKQEEELEKLIDDSELTPLGKVLAFIPLAPKYAKMLLQGRQASCLGYALLIVSSLSVEELLRTDFNVHVEESEEEKKLEGVSDDDSDADEKDLKHAIKLQEENLKLRKKQIKKQKAEVSAFKAQFSKYMVGRSDLFCPMNILGEFIKYISEQTTKNPNVDLDKTIYQYSQEKFLQAKSLKEIYNNLQQLIGIFETIIEGKAEKEALKNFFQNYKFPSASEQENLIEIIVATFVDKVARKICFIGANNRKQFAYETTENDERSYIHTTSFISNSSPDFLTYTEIVETNKFYLKNITALSDISLLIKYDNKLQRAKIEYITDPNPFYSKKHNRLTVLGKTHFGRKNWEISGFEHYFEENSLEKYVWMARSLLEGQIFDAFLAFKKFYRFETKIIKVNNLAPHVQRLINKLKNNELDTRDKLVAKWKSEKKFLLDEFLEWIRPEYKEAIAKKWPPQLTN